MVYTFFYSPSPEGETTKLFEASASTFYRACYIFHSRVSVKHPGYKLESVFDEQGNTCYLADLTAVELRAALCAAGRVLGGLS